MSIEKLQQDILRCQYVVSEITIKHYQQDNYKEIVMKIFKDYLHESGKVRGLHADNNCPDKLEPKEGYLSEESLKKLRDNLRIDNN